MAKLKVNSTVGGKLIATKDDLSTSTSSLATKSEMTSGLNAKADKTQVLTNVPSGAIFTDTKYTHPDSHLATMIVESTTKRFVSDTEKAKWNAKWDYSEATIKAVKVNKAIDADTVGGKTVLENVPSGAKFSDTVYIHPVGTNPHSTTKADVGLSLVDNVKQSSKAEFNAHDVRIASKTVLGHVKEGDNIRIAVDGTISVADSGGDVRSVNGKTGIVVLTKNEIGLPLVDNVKQATKAEFDSHSGSSVVHLTNAERISWNKITDKVDKVSGKGLSTRDYTLAEETKLSGIEAGATVGLKAPQVKLVKVDSATNSDTVGGFTVGKNVPSNALFTDTTYTKASLGLGSVTNDKQMPISGGTFTGLAKAQSNTSHTTSQLRNITFSTLDADASQMGEGDIWIKYK